jgi:hypothetical protein
MQHDDDWRHPLDTASKTTIEGVRATRAKLRSTRLQVARPREESRRLRDSARRLCVEVQAMRGETQAGTLSRLDGLFIPPVRGGKWQAV